MGYTLQQCNLDKSCSEFSQFFFADFLKIKMSPDVPSMGDFVQNCQILPSGNLT